MRCALQSPRTRSWRRRRICSSTRAAWYEQSRCCSCQQANGHKDGPVNDLYGVLVHEGLSAHHGHYLAYVKHKGNHDQARRCGVHSSRPAHGPEAKGVSALLLAPRLGFRVSGEGSNKREMTSYRSSFVSCPLTFEGFALLPVSLQYDSAEWEPAFLRQAREFLFFPLLPREASKRVPIFDRGTGSKPKRLRSGSLQADLNLIV